MQLGFHYFFELVESLHFIRFLLILNLLLESLNLNFINAVHLIYLLSNYPIIKLID